MTYEVSDSESSLANANILFQFQFFGYDQNLSNRWGGVRVDGGKGHPCPPQNIMPIFQIQWITALPRKGTHLLLRAGKSRGVSKHQFHMIIRGGGLKTPPAGTRSVGVYRRFRRKSTCQGSVGRYFFFPTTWWLNNMAKQK